MAEYGIRTRRAARSLMNKVGAFTVATNLYVRRADLLAYEEALIASRRAPASPGPLASPRARRSPRKPRASAASARPPREHANLPTDFWRTGPDPGKRQSPR